MSEGTPISNLLDGYASKTVEEIDLLVQKGLLGISAVGNADDASPAVLLFAGPQAGKVFLKLMEIMPTLPEYKEFVEIAKGAKEAK